jgi:hypothetical protein
MTVYDSFPHGFLQFDTPVKHMGYCLTAVKEIERSMARMLREGRR